MSLTPFLHGECPNLVMQLIGKLGDAEYAGADWFDKINMRKQ